MTLTPPRRRWFRYSLRTLFVVMTLFAIWLGWEINICRARKDLHDAIYANGGWMEWDADYEEPAFWFREWISDDMPIQRIRIPFTCELEFRSKAKRLFPEAEFSPVSQVELDKIASDREAQRKEEENAKEFDEHLQRGDWFMRDGIPTRLIRQK